MKEVESVSVSRDRKWMRGNRDEHCTEKEIVLQEMVAAGIQYGHSTQSWHPKIYRYIYGIRNGTHLIDLLKTYYQVNEAQRFLGTVRQKGNKFLFVGTKTQASKVVEERAICSSSYFVKERWLGGILTNWHTVKKSLLKLHRMERENKDGFSPKKAVTFRKRLHRLERYLGGLKGMHSFPGTVIIIGQTKELPAVQECINLDIPMIRRLDTDCDPRFTQVGVPMNDDSEPRNRLFLQSLVPRISLYR